MAVASGLHTRWVRQLGHSVEVGPEEDEAGAHEEEDQSDPETDVVKGLPHAHPVRHLLGKGWAQVESLKAAGASCTGVRDGGGPPEPHPTWVLPPHLARGLLVPRARSHEVHSIHTAADLGGGSAQVLAQGSWWGRPGVGDLEPRP